MKQLNQIIYSPIPESFLSKKTKFNTKKKFEFQKSKKKNSLEEITKIFIKYIRSLKTNIIDLKDAVKALNIKKRRIYDITNVLEGKQIIILIILNY